MLIKKNSNEEIMFTLKKAAIFTGLCFITLAAHATYADTAEVPVNNHPMGYYAEVQTNENPMSVPVDAQGKLAPIDEDGQTVKEEIQGDTETPKVSSRVRRAIADDVETAQASLRNAPSDLVSNDTSLPRKDAVDIASWQEWMTQSDFNQLKAQGVKTVIVKLTESTTYINPAAKAQIQMAKNAGLTVAVYHFSHFSESGKTAQATVNNTARAEANFFANVAKQYGLSTSTVMINDAEYVPEDSVGSMPYWDWTVASQNFADQLKKQGFATTRHYASKAWAVDGVGQMEPSKLGAKNLWIAQYLYGKPSASNLQNTQFGSWQYTSQMYFTGFSRQSPLDVSIDYADIFAPISPPTPNSPYLKVINGETYGFLANGQKIFGQYAINGHWYLFDKTTGIMQTGLQNLSTYGQNKTVYYGANGQMLYGEQQINGKWYLFKKNYGDMLTGLQNLSTYGKNKTVYYGANGQMLYGEQQINGKWYLFKKNYGDMLTGLQNLSTYGKNKTVYYETNGQMHYGEKKINGYWYLFGKGTGAMSFGFQDLNTYGKNKTVYYNSQGHMLYGKQIINGKTYYFDTTTGALQ
jgi:glucan-binding YG repeat protein